MIAFCAYTAVNIVLVAKELVKDMNEFNKATKYQDIGAPSIEQIILTNIADLVLLAMMLLLIADTSILWSMLLILFILFALRECFQICASIQDCVTNRTISGYLTNPENIVEVLLIICTSVILFNSDDSIETDKNRFNRNIAAFAIVLSWFEVIMLMVQHPRLSRYVTGISWTRARFNKNIR